jgi:hypothetical protein
LRGKNIKVLIQNSFFENYFSNNQYVKKVRKDAEKFKKMQIFDKKKQKKEENNCVLIPNS